METLIEPVFIKLDTPKGLPMFCMKEDIKMTNLEKLNFVVDPIMKVEVGNRLIWTDGTYVVKAVIERRKAAGDWPSERPDFVSVEAEKLAKVITDPQSK